MTPPTQTDLLVPDRSIVSLEAARAELAAKKEKRPIGSGGDFVTRDEILRYAAAVEQGITAAAMAVGGKVFDQLADETSELLGDMHVNIREEILAELRARSWRGRLRALRERVHDFLVEVGVRSPLSTPELHLLGAVEALDPNMAAVTIDGRTVP